MTIDFSIKQKARELREVGYSIKEIAQTLKISQSTSSVWVRNIEISSSGRARMLKKREVKRYKMSQKWIVKRENQYHKNFENANKILSKVNLLDKNLSRLICSILFWAEGNKDFSHIRFTNSDPTTISTFLKYFRLSYSLDETKFRACIHIHEYHNVGEIHDFWSKVTDIPISKFRKPYLKPHTGTRKKDNYKGCITIYYFDSSIARQLQALYNAISSSA